MLKKSLLKSFDMNLKGNKIIIIPCGVVARIRRSHRRGRGSIPRKGEYFLFYPV